MKGIQRNQTKMNDFHTYLVQSYANAEIDTVINGIKNSLEFNKAVINNHRTGKWSWKKGSKINDLHTFTRTLLSINDRQYSLREIASLLNTTSDTLKRKVDYALVMDTVHGASKDHKLNKYILGHKGLTKEECFAEVSAFQQVTSLEKVEKIIARDILARVRANNMSVSEFLSSTSEEILNSINNTPINYSSMLLKSVAKRTSIVIAFTKARLALSCIEKGFSIEWFLENRVKGYKEMVEFDKRENNGSYDPYKFVRKTVTVINHFVNQYNDRLANVKKYDRVPSSRSHLTGTAIEYHDDLFYYTFGNGQKRAVTSEDLSRFVMESVVEGWRESYFKELAKADKEMEVR